MMMTNSISPNQARALADLVHQLRPDWDPRGIHAAIVAVRERGTHFDICLATIRVAAEPTNRTPAVLKFDGPHWQSAEMAPRTLTNHRLCPRCRDPHPPDTECTGRPHDAIDRDSPARNAAK